MKYVIDVWAGGYVISYGDAEYKGWQCNSCCWYVPGFSELIDEEEG